MALPLDLPSQCRHGDAHDGGEEIEETIGQIGQCGHAQDRALGESAGVPGHEHGGHRAAVFAAAAEQAGFITHLGVHVLEHRTGEDDGQKLVGTGDVEENGTAHRGGYQ